MRVLVCEVQARDQGRLYQGEVGALGRRGGRRGKDEVVEHVDRPGIPRSEANEDVDRRIVAFVGKGGRGRISVYLRICFDAVDSPAPAMFDSREDNSIGRGGCRARHHGVRMGHDRQGRRTAERCR